MDHSSLSSTLFKPRSCPSLNGDPLMTISEDRLAFLDVQEGQALPILGESTKGKCPPVAEKLWNDFATSTLLQHYKEKWTHARKGNLRSKEWEHVTSALNNELTVQYTSEQVRKRIDTLLKKYNKEKEKTNANKGVRSSWKYFEVVDTLWSTAPQCAGSPQALNTTNDCPTLCMNEIKYEGEDDGAGEDNAEDKDVLGHSGEKSEALDTYNAQDIHESSGVVAKAQKLKDLRQTNLGSLVRVLTGRWKNVADTITKIDKERHMHETKMLRESQDHEERMLKLKLEEDTKRLDKYMGMQYNMVKKWANNTKPKQSSTPSANRKNFHNTFKAEVFNVVADMREFIEMMEAKAMPGSFANEYADMPNISFSKEIVNMFRYICKGYVAKIYKVEEELKHLKKQVAEKERICLDLTNLIDDLIPEPRTMQDHEVTPMTKGHKSRVSKNGTSHEPEAVSPSLKCKSILDDKACVMKLSGKEILLELEKEAEQRRLQRQKSAFSADHCNDISEENIDGLFLPWLMCEEAIDIQRQSGNENAGQELGTFLHSSQKENSIELENSNIESDGMQGSALFEWGKSIGMKGNAKRSWLTESSLISVQDTELISQKIQLRARVEAGELLLCIGTLQIF